MTHAVDRFLGASPRRDDEAGDPDLRPALDVSGGLDRTAQAVLKRIGVVAGFELGTGILVNTVDPETAAQRLRALLDLETE